MTASGVSGTGAVPGAASSFVEDSQGQANESAKLWVITRDQFPSLTDLVCSSEEPSKEDERHGGGDRNDAEENRPDDFRFSVLLGLRLPGKLRTLGCRNVSSSFRSAGCFVLFVDHEVTPSVDSGPLLSGS